MTGFMALSLLSATKPNLNLALLMSSYTSLFLSSQDFSVWWGQIPPQRVHRGNANPSQEAEAQSNQEFQQLPGETVTCKFTPSHTHSCIFMLFKRDRVVVSWGAVLTTTFQILKIVPILQTWLCCLIDMLLNAMWKFKSKFPPNKKFCMNMNIISYHFIDYNKNK